MNFNAIKKMFSQIIEALGGGWMALTIALVLVVGIVAIVLASGKEIKFKIPFLPASIGRVKISKATFAGLFKKKTTEQDGETQTEKPVVGAMFEGIDALSGDRSKRYDLPVYLVVSRANDTNSLLMDAGDNILERLNLSDAQGRRTGSCVVFNQGCLVEHEAPDAIVPEFISSRPERPLDGIILVVTVDQLLSEDRESRRTHNDWLLQQTWSIQKQVDFSLPTYVIISGADSLSGFSEFWSRPEKEGHLDDIFGWSSPLVPETPFASSWVDNAFESIADDLQRSIEHMLASSVGEVDENLILLPRSIARLSAPLKELADAVFLSSRLMSLPLVRGFYFSGKLDEEVSSEAVSPQNRFLRRLLADKIFPEYAIGFPRQDRVLSVDRRLRGLQLTASTLLIALAAWSTYGFTRANDQADQLKVAIETLIAAWQIESISQRSNYTSIDPLLENMAKVKSAGLDCCGPIPWSAIIPIEQSLEVFFQEEVFDKKVFPVMECKSRHRLSRSTEVLNFDSLGALRSSEFLPWLEQLNEELNYRSQFHKLVGPDAYSLSATAIEVEFTSLISSLFDEEAPNSLADQKALYTSAIARSNFEPSSLSSQQCDLAPIDAGMAWRLAHGAAVQAIDRNVALLSAPTTFVANLKSFESASVESTRLDQTKFDEFTDWYRLIKESYGSASINDFCTKSAQKLTDLVHLLDEPIQSAAQQIQDFSSECRQQVIAQLLSDNRAVSNQLYSNIGEGSNFYPQLSRSTSRVFDFLDQLSKTSFASVPEVSWKERQGGFFWAVDDLTRALNMIDDYRNFARDRFETPFLPQTVTTDNQAYLAQAISLSELQHSVMSTIESAKVSGLPNSDRLEFQTLDRREALISDRVANFQRALDSLLALVTALDELDLIAAKRRLLQQSQNQALDLLSDIDALYRSNQVYLPSKTPYGNAADFSEAFYGIISDQQALDYLAAQQQRSRIVAQEYAMPVVLYLSNTDGLFKDSSLVMQWLQTLIEISKVENKNPSNDITRLEQFFIGSFSATKFDNCADQVAAYPKVMGNSIFASSLTELIGVSDSFCQSLQASAIRDDYVELSQNFEQYLSPFYPFNRASTARPLSPASLRAFFRQYDGDSSALRDRLGLVASRQIEFKEAEEFVSALDDSLNILKQIIDSSRGDLGGISIEVSFDPSIGNGSGIDLSKHISNKELILGTSTVNFSSSDESLSWGFGDEVAYEIRWATGSPYVLLDEKGDDAFGKLSFAEEGSWSLLRFLERYRSTALDTSSLSPSSVLLEFDGKVRTSPANNFTVPLKLFLRVTLLGTDESTDATTELSLPTSFPTAAPTI